MKPRTFRALPIVVNLVVNRKSGSNLERLILNTEYVIKWGVVIDCVWVSRNVEGTRFLPKVIVCHLCSCQG